MYMKHIKKEKLINDFDDFVMFIYLGSFMFDKFLGQLIYRIIGILFIIYFLFKICQRGYFVVNAGILWQCTFILCVISSLLYADTIMTINLYTTFSTFGFLLGISQYFYGKKDNIKSIEKILKYLTIWGMFFMLYVLFTQASMFKYGRLGSRALSDKFGNAISFSYYSITITLLLIWNAFDNKKHTIINWLLVGLSLFISMMTGGRKAVLLPILFLILYTFLLYKKDLKKLILNCFFVIGIIILLIKLSLNVDFFYEIFGYRLEGLLYGLFGIGVGNIETVKSDVFRQALITNGLQLFKQKPIFGYGFAMSKKLNQKMGLAYIHSHNNFVEVLLSGGLVMFIAYYWIYGYTLKYLVKNYKTDITGLSQFFIAFLIMNLLSDLGTTSYNLLHFNLFIVLAAVYIEMSKTRIYVVNSPTC